MLRWFVILLIVAAAIWYGYQRYGPNAGDQPAPTASTDQTAPATPTPTPGPTLAAQRSALLSLSLSILGPLDAADAMPQPQAITQFQDLRTAVGNFAADPDYPRSVQACGLIAQALQERGDCMARYQRDSKEDTTGLDKVPGHWKIKQTGLNPGADKSVDINARNQKSRTSFFAAAILNQWKARAAYYTPAIEQLLAPGR